MEVQQPAVATEMAGFAKAAEHVTSCCFAQQDVTDKAALLSTQEQLALGELLQWIFQRKCLCRLRPRLIGVPHIRADTPRCRMYLVGPILQWANQNARTIPLPKGRYLASGRLNF
jgi:hypothetical protein